MKRGLLRGTLLAVALAVAGMVPATAGADGLPVLGVSAGPEGVPAEAGDVRYVNLPAHGNTVVARVEQNGGRVLESAFLPGGFAVPVVAFDGSASGLSTDGNTLVLIRPRATFPRAKTSFAVLDAERLRLRELVTLRGDFSFDALSPDGDLLYLIEYVAPHDPTRYVVRAYDISAGRLLRGPIVDPREPDEAMRGYPITRATSPNGRWAYTLYDGAGGHPFVHALDTRERSAACIDLHALAGRQDLYDLRLAVSADGESFSVMDGSNALALVDASTFEVAEPAEPAPPLRPESVTPSSAPSPRVEASAPGGGPPWLLAGAAGGGILLALALLAVLRRRMYAA